LSLSKNRPVYFSKQVSQIGFCLRLQVKPTQLGPIDRASPYLAVLELLRQTKIYGEGKTTDFTDFTCESARNICVRKLENLGRVFHFVQTEASEPLWQQKYS
jgi:hypothetical protein